MRMQPPGAKHGLATVPTDLVEERDSGIAECRPSASGVALLRCCKQKRQIDTPEFKAWFGDSKIVGASGDPLGLVHWTTTEQEFQAFLPGGMDPEMSGIAIWMSVDPEDMLIGHNMLRALRAGRGFDEKGRLIPAEVVSRRDNPGLGESQRKRIGGNINRAIDGGRIQGLRALPLFAAISNPAIFRGEGGAAQGAEGSRAKITLLYPEDVSALKAKGFDGAVAYDLAGNIVEVAAFSANQVKSALGNCGAFDPANPGICR